MRIDKYHQNGVVLVVTLISLVIMLLASIALIRSTDTNLLIAGNVSFKRDIINQGEISIPVIRARFLSGALAAESARKTNLLAANYYATIQASNSSGIPNLLLNKEDFDSALGTNNIVDTTNKVTIRYMIDRMCLTTGAVSLFECAIGVSTTDITYNSLAPINAKGQDKPVYRISIRVTGPRNTEVFLQSTFSA